jgi:hypothetical protein
MAWAPPKREQLSLVERGRPIRVSARKIWVSARPMKYNK